MKFLLKFPDYVNIIVYVFTQLKELHAFLLKVIIRDENSNVPKQFHCLITTAFKIVCGESKHNRSVDMSRLALPNAPLVLI